MYLQLSCLTSRAELVRFMLGQHCGNEGTDRKNGWRPIVFGPQAVLMDDFASQQVR